MRASAGRGLRIAASALCCGWMVVATLHGCGQGDEPFFQSVLLPADTDDAVGPYRIEAYVVAPHGIKEVGARVAAPDAATFNQIPASGGAESGEAQLWWIDLPGRPLGTTYYFYLFAVDIKGNKVVDPEGAPDDLATFSIRP